ncbi:MAG: YciI family protein [Acidobacteriota bacterium]
MPFALLASVRADSDAIRAQLRHDHLRYIDDHKSSIVAGGPTLRDGKPETMIVLTSFIQRSDAEAFIRMEPYNASGRVFSSVEILDWSQVLPEREAAQTSNETT